MIDEMCSLQSSDTRDLAPPSPPLGKSVVGCPWIFTMKLGPVGKVDRLKVHLWFLAWVIGKLFVLWRK